MKFKGQVCTRQNRIAKRLLRRERARHAYLIAHPRIMCLRNRDVSFHDHPP